MPPESSRRRTPHLRPSPSLEVRPLHGLGAGGKEYVDMVGEEEAMGLERDEKKESWIGTI